MIRKRFTRRLAPQKEAVPLDQVRICVVSAHGLRNGSKQQLSPFVVLRCAGLEQRTSCARGAGDDATWNETLVFKLPASSPRVLAFEIEVWNEPVLDLWAEGIVSVADYLGSTRIDDAAEPSRRGVRSLRKPLTFRVGQPPPQLGEPAPLQCGDLLLEVHFTRAADDQTGQLVASLLSSSTGSTAAAAVSLDSSGGVTASSGAATTAFGHTSVDFERGSVDFADDHSPSTSAKASPRGPAPLTPQQQLQQQQQQQLMMLGRSSNQSSGGAPHGKMTLTTVPLFSLCALCGDVCWGVALQAYSCGDCHQVFHRRCQQQAALQTACAPDAKVSKPKNVDMAKKRKKIDRLAAELYNEPHVGVDRLLEFMTWVASAYDVVASDSLFACLHGKAVSAGVIPSVLESLASRDIFARLVAVSVLQQLLYCGPNKTAVIGKGGVQLLLQSLREMQQYFLDSVSQAAAAKATVAAAQAAAQAASTSPAAQRRSLMLAQPVRGGDSARDDQTIISPFYEVYLQDALALLVFLAGEEARATCARENALDLFLRLCRFQTENRVVQLCLGALLMQFADDAAAWQRIMGDPEHGAVRVVLAAAESGMVTLHRDIRPSELALERTIFSSPLCEVLVGRWKGIEVAVKVFDTNSIAWSWEAFFSEVAMLSIAQDRTVVRLYGANSHRDSLRPFVVMELAAGTVSDMIDVVVARKGRCALSDSFTVHVGAEIAAGLALLHARGVVHRDIKSANFLINDAGEIKLIDFGVSRVLQRGKTMNTVVGTPVWMAPEVLRGHRYNNKADIFSFSLVLAHLLNGEEPFHDVPSLSIGDAVVGGRRPTLPRFTTPALRDLITHCWSDDEDARYSAAALVAQLAVIQRQLHEQPAVALTRMPEMALAALFSHCSFAMLCQLSATCKALAGAVRAYRRHALVPLEQLALASDAPYDVTLRQYAWFHGPISKTQAHAMLVNMPNGAFLVRASSLPNHWVLCGQFDRQLLQILVSPVSAPTTGYTIDIQGDTRVYPTMLKLIKMYRHVLKSAIVRSRSEPTHTVTPFTCGDLVRECALHLRSGPAKDHRTNPNSLRPIPALGDDLVDDNSGGHLSPRARKLSTQLPLPPHEMQTIVKPM